MTPPSPISTDPLEVLEKALNGPAALTEPMPSLDSRLREDALRGLAALQQVRELVEAVRRFCAPYEADQDEHTFYYLQAALSPFIPQGTEET